jgi:hypothetical protein
LPSDLIKLGFTWRTKKAFEKSMGADELTK